MPNLAVRFSAVMNTAAMLFWRFPFFFFGGTDFGGSQYIQNLAVNRQNTGTAPQGGICMTGKVSRPVFVENIQFIDDPTMSASWSKLLTVGAIGPLRAAIIQGHLLIVTICLQVFQNFSPLLICRSYDRTPPLYLRPKLHK